MKITAKFCVYTHACDGEIIYVGSGTHARAFNLDHACRTKRWVEAVAGRTVTVNILSEHDDRADAYEREADWIYGLQPAANGQGKSQRLSARGLKLGRPRRKGPRPGAFIWCRTLDVRCPTLRFAARLVDMPLTSVSRALHAGKPLATKHHGDVYFVLAWD